MELNQFVAESIKQIIDGVCEAQVHARDVRAAVNPSDVNTNEHTGHVLYHNVPLQNVEFDVAVSATEGSGNEGGAGLFVGPVAIGTRGQSEASSTAVSRIKFTVPMALPTQTNE